MINPWRVTINGNQTTIRLVKKQTYSLHGEKASADINDIVNHEMISLRQALEEAFKQ